MIINNNTVEQINIALLDIDKKLKTTSVTSAQIQQIQRQIDNVQRTLRETSIGLSSGGTYNINITGNASSASYAVEAGSAKVTTTAQSAEIANYANTAGSATSATTATTATTAQSATKADSADYATKAEKDSSNNTITTTYQNKNEKNSKAGYAVCDKTENGTYVLAAVVADGIVEYSWTNYIGASNG